MRYIMEVFIEYMEKDSRFTRPSPLNFNKISIPTYSEVTEGLTVDYMTGAESMQLTRTEYEEQLRNFPNLSGILF